MEVEESIWKKGVRKDAGTKDLGPCHRIKRGIYTKKGESILTIEKGKEGSTDICKRPVEEGIYLTLQVTPDIASVMRALRRNKFPTLIYILNAWELK